MPALPMNLVHDPERKLSLKEPQLHYGWILDESVLLNYVRDHRIGVEYKEEPLEPGETDKGGSVLEWINMENALRQISKNIGLANRPELVFVHNNETRKGALFISLINNYNFL